MVETMNLEDVGLRRFGLEELTLDPRNPRFPADASSPDEAFDLMMTVEHDSLAGLLKDIIAEDRLNPTEMPVVVEEDGDYVVLEGNRRLTVLLIWQDPERVQDGRTRRKFNSIIAKADRPPLDSMIAYVVDDRSEADHWMDLRHNKGGGGAAVSTWSAFAKERRTAQRDPSKASIASAFFRYMRAHYFDDEPLGAALQVVQDRNYSMVSRMIQPAAIRSELGLELRDGELKTLASPAHMKPVFARLINDLAEPRRTKSGDTGPGDTWARAIKTEQDALDYFREQPHLFPRQLRDTHAGAQVPPMSSSKPSSGGAASGGLTRGQSHSEGQTALDIASSKGDRAQPIAAVAPRPSRPQDYVFRGLDMGNFSSRLQEVVRQTSTLRLSAYSEVAGIMLRAILDLSTYQFLKSHGRTPTGGLEKRIQSAIKVIEPTAHEHLKKVEADSPLKTAYHQTDSNRMQLLQHFVHNGMSSGGPQQVLSMARVYEPVLVAMNKNFGDNPIS